MRFQDNKILYFVDRASRHDSW